MADNILATTPTQSEATGSPQQQETIPQELKNQMEASLAMWNGGKMPENVSSQQQTNEAETVQDGGTIAGGQEGQTATPPPQFSFQTFTEKFGYQNPDDAIKEIEELRAAREKYNAPISIEDIEFENEVSEKLYKAVSKGDRREVYKILEQQERLDSLTSAEITKDNAAEIIKYGMALKYPDLTQEEIDYKFNKQFGIPKTPVQRDDETEDEFNTRMDGWKEAVRDIEMGKTIEAKLLKPELEAAKQKIILPEIQEQVDEGYEQYKKMLQQQQQSAEEVTNAYKTVTPEMAGMKLNFKDEANKIEFNFDYKPTEQQFSEAISMVSNFQKFFDHFKKPDGTPDREGFLQAIIFAVNRKEILMEGLKQAKNGTVKSKLPDNTQGGMIRQMPANEAQKNELDEMMRAALAVR